MANIKRKVGLLQGYLSEFRHLSSTQENDVDKSFYPILRMLLPQAERERSAYGIKETTLAKIYIRILNLPKKGYDATKLMNYKAPSSSLEATADFGDVAFYVLKSKSLNPGNLTVQEVNERLDRIAQFHAENKPRSVDEEFTKFVTSITAFQQKWLIRIILKELRLGMGQQRILSCFHTDASDLFDSCNSLSKVCSVLHSPSVRLHEIEIDLFSPFRPMLSEKLDITKIKGAIKKDEEYFIEMKFDGERFQIHMKDKKFKYFSRNGFDYTENYGGNFESGLLTKYLEDTLNPNVSSFILDGEMMGWHKGKKRFGSKGMLFDVKKMSEMSTYRPCFCAFDLLLRNDQILTGRPLKDRLIYLDELFQDKEGVIIHSERKTTTKSDEVLAALNEAIEKQDEGVVLKNTMSLYKPNARKKGWFKIKPEYTDGAMNEMDLLIIGGYYSENKRHGSVGSVMLGVAVPNQVEGTNPSVFHSVGRVMLALRMEELEILCSKLEPHWRAVYRATELPSSLCWTRDKPDLWIEPQNSCILQIKASELIRSNAFKTEFTLRFPRIVKVRDDKPWFNCMTTVEFAEITANSRNVEKLTARKIEGDELLDDGDVSPRKRARILQVASQFKAADLTGVQELSSLFSGKEICVMTGDTEISKEEIEEKIKENGGRVVQNPGVSTFCIIAGTINARVNNVIKSFSHNVVTVDWFLNSIEPQYISKGKIPEWTPKDLIGMSRDVAEDFALKYDEFGDSYTNPATRESLEYSMEKVTDAIGKIYPMPIELLHLDRELFPKTKMSPYSFLRMCNVHFIEDFSSLPPREVVKAEQVLRILKIELKFFAGLYFDKLVDEGLTHVLIPKFVSKEKINEIRGSLEAFVNKPLLLSIEWLENCIKKKMRLMEDDFKYII